MTTAAASRQVTRRALGAAIWAVAAKFVTVAVTLVFNVILARRLPTAEVGEFLMISSFVYVAATLATLGVNSSLLRSLASQGTNGLPVTIATAWRLVTGGSIVAAAVGAPIAFAMTTTRDGSSARTVAALTALWIVAQAMTLLLSDCLRGAHRVRLASFFDGTQGGLLPVAISTAVLLSSQGGAWESLPRLLGLVVGSTVLNLLVGIAILIGIRRELSSPLKAPVPATTTILVESLPFLGTTIFLLLRTQMGLWIVGALGSPEDAAVFGIAQRVMNAVMLPSMVITNALQPAVAQLIRSPDQHALEPLLRRMATLTTLPVLAAALALQLFGEQLVTLVFGPTYAAGTGVLLVLAIGNLIFAWCGAPGLVLSMSGHQRTNMAIYLLTVLLTVVFGIPAMWAFGMMGVAVTIGLLGFANKLLTMWVTNREFGIRTDVTFQFLGSPAPASE